MRDRNWSQLRRRAEKGGAAMIVAVVLGGGVLLGASALAIDVGNMMFERRQLQNGADAASRKLAQICAKDPTQCNAATATTVNSLNSLNNSNANDNVSALDSSHSGSGTCGRVPTSALTPCTTAESNAAVTDWVQCPALPSDWASGTSPYVQVYTTTSTNGSPGVLDSFFSSKDSKPGACARYGWGPATQASFFPFAIIQCEYDDATTPPSGWLRLHPRGRDPAEVPGQPRSRHVDLLRPQRRPLGR